MRILADAGGMPDEIIEESTAALAGAVLSRTSLSRNKGLGRALRRVSSAARPLSTLCDVLPSSVLQIVHGEKPLSTIDDLRDEVDKNIRAMEPVKQQQVLEANMGYPIDSIETGDVSREMDHEMVVEEIEQVLARARLSRREEIVWRLDAQAIPGKEIADYLRMSPTTARTTLSRARKKIEKAKIAHQLL